MERVKKFQKEVFQETSQVFKNLALDLKWCEEKNKPDCFPVNFLRWQTNDPNNVFSVLGKIEEEFIKNCVRNTKQEPPTDVVKKII